MTSMLTFLLTIVVTLSTVLSFVDKKCVNQDGSLAPSATNCYNLYGDMACSYLYPDNDPSNPMKVGMKNERPIQCFTDDKNITSSTVMQVGVRMAALLQCPQRCGYCCVSNVLDTYFAIAFDCVGVPMEFCQDPLIGNMVKRYCPEKCGLNASQPKIGH